MSLSWEELEAVDFYRLLALDRSAGDKEIRGAFRAFARKYHPDRFAGAAAEQIDQADRIYRRGTEALQTLTDVAARRAYDEACKREAAQREAAQRQAATPASAARAAPGMAPPPIPKAAKGSESLGIDSMGANLLYEQALAALRKEDYDRAYEAITQADATEPGNAVILARMDQIMALRARSRRSR